MFYYAVLNENNFVVELVESETEITNSTYISITQDQYTNGDLLWLYYSQGQFIVCDNWIGSCDWIYYKNTNRPITPKFDEIDSQIAGKANIEHAHNLGDITETDSQKIMTAAERTKLSGIAENANNYVHPESHAASMISGLSSVATSGSYNDLTDKPSIPTIPESLPANGGNADTVDGYHAVAFAQAEHNHDESYANASHTHDIDEVTGLETALAEKANANHTEHSGEIVANKTAGVGITLQSSYGKTRIHKNSNATTDYGTIISDYDINGKRDYIQLRRNAPSAERKLFLMSESTDGSVAQYKIYGEHNKPGILWSGVVFPGGDSTMTLSKNISECRGGILLLWCDYDPDTSTANNNEFVTTIIPRMSPTGGNWNGESFYCEVPRHIGNDTYDVTTESRVIKKVKVYNGKLEGYVENARGLRSDIILRAIYEF